MGFGISHQKAGLNWPGRYKAWSRERALADAWEFWLQHKGTKTRRHEEGETGRHGDTETRRRGDTESMGSGDGSRGSRGRWNRR